MGKSIIFFFATELYYFLSATRIYVLYTVWLAYDLLFLE